MSIVYLQSVTDTILLLVFLSLCVIVLLCSFASPLIISESVLRPVCFDLVLCKI